MDINYTYNEETGKGAAIPNKAHDLNSLYHETLDILNEYIPPRAKIPIEKIAEAIQERIIDRVMDSGLIVKLENETLPIRLYRPPMESGDFGE